MNIIKKVQKKFNYLSTSYGLLCNVKPKHAVCYYNDKVFITFEYDFYRHEFFNLKISKCGLNIMESYFGNISWGDNNFIDEKFRQRLENVYALKHQYFMLSDKQLDELIEIFADYLNGIMNKFPEDILEKPFV